MDTTYESFEMERSFRNNINEIIPYLNIISFILNIVIIGVLIHICFVI